MILRDYQKKLIEEIRNVYRQGFMHPCIVLGCGGGKSIICAELAKRTTDRKNRVLFIVHRKELCEQIEATFSSWGVNMEYCMVGMVQTITRRLSKIPEPQLIITDENHHCLARSYRRIYDYYPSVRTIGMTATPIRLNGGGLGGVNDKLIVGVSNKYLISNNYLSSYDYYAPPVADLSGLHTSKGDYIASEITERMNKPKIYGDVIRYYKELSNQKAICYCASIEHSKRTAEEFSAAGIPAVHIDGDTPQTIRREAVQKFRDGTIQVLCNVDLISEGFDVPDCSTAILLRPTKSLTLFIQQSMRCMRYMPGKKAIIIDHVGNYARFGLPDADREWDLNPKRTQQKVNLIKVRQCPKCFYTHETGAICPQCGYQYPPIKPRTIEEVKAARLQKINTIVINYQRPSDCKSYGELQAYAKRHNYKPGWAWHQARLRGWLQ